MAALRNCIPWGLFGDGVMRTDRGGPVSKIGFSEKASREVIKGRKAGSARRNQPGTGCATLRKDWRWAAGNGWSRCLSRTEKISVSGARAVHDDCAGRRQASLRCAI